MDQELKQAARAFVEAHAVYLKAWDGLKAEFDPKWGDDPPRPNASGYPAWEAALNEVLEKFQIEQKTAAAGAALERLEALLMARRVALSDEDYGFVRRWCDENAAEIAA